VKNINIFVWFWASSKEFISKVNLEKYNINFLQPQEIKPHWKILRELNIIAINLVIRNMIKILYLN